MCGGELEVTPNSLIAECPYCGTKQTLPKLDTDKKTALYDRANHFRRMNEFDKAMAVYEMILNEDETDSEAYWSIVLCRYGIEYVKDPNTNKRVPTVNRTQYTSIFSDTDYLKAYELADELQKSILEEEAKQIDYIQKSILEISSKEEPFDIFICYKETDQLGQRTQDSVYAQEIYQKLTDEGYKVFFSRITLEDKLGVAYEPYIFAALNSAKVMLVVGTRAEYFNAVWVKNEWSRYISLIKQGDKKNLIPVYRDIDPYELPVEFSYLQAVNMGTVGYMQDLIRGINKLIKPNTNQNRNSNESFEEQIVRTSIDKAFDLISKCDYENANLSLDTAKGYDPSNVQIYVGKLLVTNQLSNIEQLKSVKKPLEEDDNYKLALKYADVKLKEELEEYNRYTLYNYADTLKPKNAIEVLGRLNDFLDSSTKVDNLKKYISKRNKKIISVIAVVVLSIFGWKLINEKYIIPQGIYDQGIANMESRNYIMAKSEFRKIEGYLDSSEKITECEYLEAINLFENNKFDTAIEEFTKLNGYKESNEYILKSIYKGASGNHFRSDYKYLDYLKELSDIQYEDSATIYVNKLESIYDSGLSFIKSKNYSSAIATFTVLNKHQYKDSEKQLEKANSLEKARLEKLERDKKETEKALKKLVGTWKGDGFFKPYLKITSSYTISYKLGKDGTWYSYGPINYNPDTNKYTFYDDFDDSYTGKLSGNTLIITTKNGGFIDCNYKKTK